MNITKLTKSGIDVKVDRPAGLYTCIPTYSWAPVMSVVLPIIDNNGKFIKFTTVSKDALCKNYIGEELFRMGVGIKRNFTVIHSKEDSMNKDGGYWILYAFTRTSDLFNVVKQFNLINKFEKGIGILSEDQSKYYYVKDNPTKLLVYCGPVWTYSPLLTSIHITFIRCLTEETNCSTMLKHLKHLVKKNKGSDGFFRDLQYLDEVFKEGISLRDLVLNRKDYIHENDRFSGLNDEILRGICHFINQGCDKSIDIDMGSNGIIQHDFRADHIHSNSGIHSFAVKVMELMKMSDESLKDTTKLKLTVASRSIGFLWAYRYVCKKRGIK